MANEQKVTDPNLIAALESKQGGQDMQKVTDPNLIAQLEGGQQPSQPKTLQELQQQYGSLDPLGDQMQSASLGFINLPVEGVRSLADMATRPFGYRVPSPNLKQYAKNPWTFEAFNLLGGGNLPVKSLQKGSGVLKNLANITAHGAGYGALFGEPEDKTLEGATTGAIAAPITVGVGKLLGAGAKKLVNMLPDSMKNRIYSMLEKGGHLTPEKMSRAKEIHSQFEEKGVPVDLMHLLDSPEGIKMLDQIVRTVPESSALPMMRTVLEAENHVIGNMAEHLSGGSESENLDKEIVSEIQNHFNPLIEKNSREWESFKNRMGKFTVKEHEPLDKFIAEEIEKYKRAQKGGDEPAMSKAMKNVLETVGPKYEKVSDLSPEGLRVGEKEQRVLGTVADRMDTYRAEGQKFQDIIDAKNPYDNVVLAKLRGHISDQIEKSLKPHWQQKQPHFNEWERLKKQHIEDKIPTHTPTMQDILQPNREINQQTYIGNLLNDSNRKALQKLPQSTVNKIILKHLMQDYPNAFEQYRAGNFSKGIFPEDLSSAKILNKLKSKNFNMKTGELMDETTKRHIGHIQNFKDMTGDYRIAVQNVYGTGRALADQLKNIANQDTGIGEIVGFMTQGPKGYAMAKAMKALNKQIEKRGPEELEEFTRLIFKPEFINEILSGEVPKENMLKSGYRKMLPAGKALTKAAAVRSTAQRKDEK